MSTIAVETAPDNALAGMPAIVLPAEASNDWIAAINSRAGNNATLHLTDDTVLEVAIIGADRDDTGMPYVLAIEIDADGNRTKPDALRVSSEDLATIAYY